MTLTVDDRELIEAREALAVAHEGARKPLIALDIRNGNVGRQGVMWVETTTALAALQSLLSDRDKLREALQTIADDDYDPVGVHESFTEAAAEIARAALIQTEVP